MYGSTGGWLICSLLNHAGRRLANPAQHETRTAHLMLSWLTATATGRSSRGATFHTCRMLTSPKAPLVATKLAERHVNMMLRVLIPPAQHHYIWDGKACKCRLCVGHTVCIVCNPHQHTILPYLLCCTTKSGMQDFAITQSNIRNADNWSYLLAAAPLCMISHRMWAAWSLTLHAAPRSQVKVTKPSVKPRTLAADHPAPVRP